MARMSLNMGLTHLCPLHRKVSVSGQTFTIYYTYRFDVAYMKALKQKLLGHLSSFAFFSALQCNINQ